MANNVTIPATGSGDATPTVATEDIGSVQYQRIKLIDATASATAATGVAANPLQVSLANTAANATAVKVDGSAATQPISGTVAATQSGTWTVQPGNTANTTAWKVDGSAVTQPVSAAALPLPALAATSTKQSDGTQKSQIVDGSGNVIASTANALNVNIASGSIGTSHVIVDSGTLTAVTTLTNALPAGSNVIGHVIADSGSTTAVTGNVTVVQSTASSLKTQATGAGSAGTADTGVLTVQGIASMTKLLVTPDANSAINVAQLNGATVNVGAGNAGTGTARVSISTDDVNLAAINAVAGTTAGSAVITDANGTIQQYLRGIVKLAITAGGWLVTASLAAGSNLVGYVGRKFTVGNASTLTTTNFSGLTSGSGWQSAAITPAGASDILFSFTTLGAAGSTAYVDIYVAESNGTTYSDGATGTEGTFTAANRKNSRYLGSILCNTTNSVTGTLRVSDVMLTPNSLMALIAINNSGGTISATGGNTVFTYQLVY